MLFLRIGKFQVQYFQEMVCKNGLCLPRLNLVLLTFNRLV